MKHAQAVSSPVEESESSNGSGPFRPSHSPSPHGNNGANGSNGHTSLFYQLAKWVKHNLGVKNESSLREALEEVLEEHDDGDSRLVSSEEKTLFKNMLAFSELTVSDIMIPRTDIVAVPQSMSLVELKKFILEERHTRLPVYEDSLDSIGGFIHLKDIVQYFDHGGEFTMEKVVREILFVPPSMRIIDLLLKMRVEGCHMAIVVDEYGGTDGLVTMEDMFEEIVGEIQDEHDEEEAQELAWVGDRIIEADARVKIEKLEEETGMDFIEIPDDEDFDTLGGFVFSHLGRVPAKGEVIEDLAHLRIEILEADPRRIKRVRLHWSENAGMHSISEEG